MAPAGALNGWAEFSLDFPELNQSELSSSPKSWFRKNFPLTRSSSSKGSFQRPLRNPLGSVRVYQTSLDGERRRSTPSGRAFFGEMGLSRRSAAPGVGGRQRRDCAPRYQPADPAPDPQVAGGFVEGPEALCDRIRKMDEEILDMSFRDVPYRVMRTLIRLSKEHGEQRLTVCASTSSSRRRSWRI